VSSIPLSLTSLIIASSCFDVESVLDGVFVNDDNCDVGFDGVSVVSDGTVVNADCRAAALDGVPTFLRGLEGVVEVTVDFKTSLVVFVSPSSTARACVLSVTPRVCVLSLLSSTLVHLCRKNELESEVKLVKLLVRLRLALVSCRLAGCNDVFGKVFGVEEQS